MANDSSPRRYGRAEKALAQEFVIRSCRPPAQPQGIGALRLLAGDISISPVIC
jgi:hypothetical protein